MSKPKISIIIAVYKSEQFLPKLIESIINQTYSNLEIILVDDCSPDKSPQICDRYAMKDDRIRVIHKENGGACEARNYGLMAVTGDYFAIVDGDDWLECDFIEYLYGIICETGADMALSDRIFTTRDRQQTQEDRIEVWSSETAVAAIIYPRMEVGPWNKLYKTALIREHNISFSVPWSGEGLYFASMAAWNAKKVGVGHRKVYNYRLNNVNSGLTNYNVQMGINALWNIKNINNILSGNSALIDDAIKNHIFKNYYFLIFLILATDSKKKYHKEYIECRKGMFSLLINRLVHSGQGLKRCMVILVMAFYPKLLADRELKYKKRALEQDIMK